MTTFAQSMAELQALKQETAQLEAQVQAQLQALFAEFHASYPPLKIVEQVCIPTERLSQWLHAAEVD